jgi:hypothetical protein
LNAAKSAVSNSTYGPTETAIKSLEIASAQLEEIKAGLKVITEQTIPELKKKLVEVGAPVVK